MSPARPLRDAPESESPSTGTESVGSFDEDLPERDGLTYLLAGSVVAGRFVVQSVLGRGGYAVVYRATDRESGQDVALKILREDRLGRIALKRLAREAETARQFQNERLVRVLDSGTFGDNAFLAMELVLGETLRERRASRPLATNEAVDIACDVLEGLAALHAGGGVHRDVKPSNILIDRNGRAKLADFGLVTRWNEDQSRATESHAIVGTIEYVSPEQALGEELDGRSDLYAIGVVLFEMLSGSPLHGMRSSLGTLVAHLTKPAPDVRASRNNVPDWLAAVVARLLEKDRRLRYPSAAVALADLRARRSPGLPGKSVTRRLTVTLAVLAIAALLSLAWQDASRRALDAASPNVAGAEVRAGRLHALDDRGNSLWSRDVGPPLDGGLYAPTALSTTPRLRVADLEGDGRNEVLLTAPGAEGALNQLFVFDSDGRERFRRLPGRRVIFGKEAFETFTANATYFFIDARGRRRLFVLSAHRPWFPSVLEELDPTGRVVSEYFASGVQLGVTRLRVRGADVLVLNGFHNESRGGSLTFLSLDKPSGRAPAEDPEFLCVTCPQEDPLSILVMPRSDVLAAQGGEEATASAAAVITIDDGVIDTGVEQGVFLDETGLSINAHVSYRFASDLSKVVEVKTAHSLSVAHDVLFKTGRLDHRFGARDLNALNRVRTWDGKRWVTLPAK